MRVELPRYMCHKEVRALKIREVVCHAHEDPAVTIDEFAETEQFSGGHMFPENSEFAPIPFDAEFYRRHRPEAGGYYVVYGDGYKSFSPSKAFEDGYTLVAQ